MERLLFAGAPQTFKRLSVCSLSIVLSILLRSPPEGHASICLLVLFKSAVVMASAEYEKSEASGVSLAIVRVGGAGESAGLDFSSFSRRRILGSILSFLIKLLGPDSLTDWGLALPGEEMLSLDLC